MALRAMGRIALLTEGLCVPVVFSTMQLFLSFTLMDQGWAIGETLTVQLPAHRKKMQSFHLGSFCVEFTSFSLHTNSQLVNPPWCNPDVPQDI